MGAEKLIERLRKERFDGFVEVKGSFPKRYEPKYEFQCINLDPKDGSIEICYKSLGSNGTGIYCWLTNVLNLDSFSPPLYTEFLREDVPKRIKELLDAIP